MIKKELSGAGTTSSPVRAKLRGILDALRDMARPGFLSRYSVHSHGVFSCHHYRAVPQPTVLGPGRASGFVQVPGTRLGQNYPVPPIKARTDCY